MTMPLPHELPSQEVNIHYEERNGWVRIFTDAAFRAHPQLPVFLSATLAQWIRERPLLCLRSVVPILKGGDVVELHAWYDLNVYPAPSNGQATLPSRT